MCDSNLYITTPSPNMTQQSDKIILVTGINGYLASNIGMAVLQRGYRLRGTVRAADRASQLMNGPWEEYASRIEIVEVPDICADSAFDEAVKGRATRSVATLATIRV